MIESLILDPMRDANLFEKDDSPWHNAVLITPRNAVPNKWNELACRRHCLRTGQKLIQSHSYYTRNGKPLDHDLRILLNAGTIGGDDGVDVTKSDSGGLSDVVPLAKGISVMVTYNIETELDIANGTRGVIERILIQDNTIDPILSDAATLVLTNPPMCVLVRLSRTKVSAISGLEAGVVPIVPIRTKLPVTLPGGKSVTIWHEQVPLTPAYAFTDYRSQGQILPYVIVDLATPPYGAFTPFNAYVALSRSRSRETIRLLQDFNPKLFTTPLDENLINEDKNLADFDEATKREMEKDLGGCLRLSSGPGIVELT